MGSRIMVARLLVLGALVCGLIGLIAGLIDRSYKLGATGWFTGGTLLAVLAVAVIAEVWVQAKSEGGA